MSRVLPVSHLKAKGKIRGCPIHVEPRAGSALREVYDLFSANKGVTISYSYPSGSNRKLQDLIDYYGLDIRRMGWARYCLVGEWFGKVYIDYLAEHIETPSKQGVDA